MSKSVNNTKRARSFPDKSKLDDAHNLNPSVASIDAEAPSSKHIKGMEGDGYYNNNSRPQAAGNLLGLHAWTEAVKSAIANSNRDSFLQVRHRSFHIADYGSSQGRNTIPLVRAAIEILPHDASIVVTHMDLPTNDFNSLIRLANDKKEGYVQDGNREVFSSARGGSFYKKIFPDASVHLAWSAIATHWLSEVPDVPLNHFMYSNATNPERVAYVARAREDWHNFVKYRAQEIVSGGQFVHVGLSRDEHGRTGGEVCVRFVEETLKPVLSQKEYESLRLPTYHRSAEEWLEPFLADPETWTVKYTSMNTLSNPLYEEYLKDGDLDKYANAVAGVTRAAMFAGLFRDGTRHDLDDLTRRLSENIKRNPTESDFAWKIFVIHVERR